MNSLPCDLEFPPQWKRRTMTRNRVVEREEKRLEMPPKRKVGREKRSTRHVLLHRPQPCHSRPTRRYLLPLHMFCKAFNTSRCMRNTFRFWKALSLPPMKKTPERTAHNESGRRRRATLEHVKAVMGVPHSAFPHPCPPARTTTRPSPSRWPLSPHLLRCLRIRIFGSRRSNIDVQPPPPPPPPKWFRPPRLPSPPPPPARCPLRPNRPPR